MANQNNSNIWDEVADDDLVEAAEQIELELAFETAIVDLNDAVEISDVDLVSYYEEMGRILAVLSADTTLIHNYIPDTPIEDLDVEDVVNGQPEVVEYVGGGGEPSEIKDRLFTVVRKSEREFENKFKTQGVLYSVDIMKPNPKTNPADWLVELFDGIRQHFTLLSENEEDEDDTESGDNQFETNSLVSETNGDSAESSQDDDKYTNDEVCAILRFFHKLRNERGNEN